MTLDEFNAQLNDLENTLMAYYKQKTLLISARETFRFQYITALKTKWTSLLQAMYQQGYTQANSNGVNLLSAITSLMQSLIPMVDVNGNTVTGWNSPPQNVGSGGNVTNASYLSPIENLISKPFYPPTNLDQRPAYALYVGYWSGPSDAIVANAILPAAGLHTYDTVKADGSYIEFSIPPSIEWCKSYFSYNKNIANYLDESYPFAASVLSANYAMGNLNSIIQEFKDMLAQIIYKTQLIISLQTQIDAAENDLSTFVASFTSFGSTLNVAQILLDLQAAAEAAATAPPPPPPAQPEVLSTAPIPIVPPAPAPAPSKLVWIAAAAVLGVIAMTGKK